MFKKKRTQSSLINEEQMLGRENEISYLQFIEMEERYECIDEGMKEIIYIYSKKEKIIEKVSMYIDLFVEEGKK